MDRPERGGKPVLQVLAPMPEEDVFTQRGDYTIRGTAYDPNAPSGSGAGVDRVQVYINGPREGTGSFLGNATISGTDWSLTFTPTRYRSAHANLYVYARSKQSGQEATLIRGFNITDRSP